MEDVINLQSYKVEGALDVEFDLEGIKRDGNIGRIDSKLSDIQSRLDELNKDIDFLTNQADFLDYTVAVGSGVLAGIIDIFWVGRFNFEEGKAFSNRQVNEFVMETAKKQGYEGERLDGAIKFLEDKFKVPSDNVWKGEGVGISAKSHHLDDLAHHPTPLGLFFSILTQFTGKGYFQNREGSFIPISIGEGSELIGHDFPNKILAGTTNWFFHLVSDMSGSNKTAGAGMGIPGPIVSLLKEASLIPGLNKTGLPEAMHQAFVKNKFDLRSEIAVGHQLGKQAVPVIFNEVLVRSFYFIRRLITELKEKKSIREVEWKYVLPFKNRTIIRMLTISTGVMTVIDLGDAAVRGALKSGGNQAAFFKEFILNVNFVGVGRFALAVGSEVKAEGKKSKLERERIKVMNGQLHLLNAKSYYMMEDSWRLVEGTERSIDETIDVMEKSIVISKGLWLENVSSLENIRKYRDGIKENNSDCIDEMLDMLEWGN